MGTEFGGRHEARLPPARPKFPPEAARVSLQGSAAQAPQEVRDQPKEGQNKSLWEMPLKGSGTMSPSVPLMKAVREQRVQGPSG